MALGIFGLMQAELTLQDSTVLHQQYPGHVSAFDNPISHIGVDMNATYRIASTLFAALQLAACGSGGSENRGQSALSRTAMGNRAPHLRLSTNRGADSAQGAR
jgi:hypothetical protein